MIARPAILSALITAALLGLQAFAHAQSERMVSIGGRLVDPDGAPVRDARVAILTGRNQDLRCEHGPGSDGCFETLKVLGGTPFAITRHLARLRTVLSAGHTNHHRSRDAWPEAPA